MRQSICRYCSVAVLLGLIALLPRSAEAQEDCYQTMPCLLQETVKCTFAGTFGYTLVSGALNCPWAILYPCEIWPSTGWCFAVDGLDELQDQAEQAWRSALITELDLVGTRVLLAAEVPAFVAAPEDFDDWAVLARHECARQGDASRVLARTTAPDAQ